MTVGAGGGWCCVCLELDLPQAQATGAAADEAKATNMSLLALGKVIAAMAEGKDHVPYRDSKLTRLLNDAFGLRCKTSLVITVNPSRSQLQETESETTGSKLRALHSTFELLSPPFPLQPLS